MTRAAFLVLVLLTAGCGSIELGPEWLPLTHVKELPGTPRGVAVTKGDTVRVGDLVEWLSDHQEPVLSAVLLHEQEHAKRQFAAGVSMWLKNYFSDPVFAWREEQRGWYLYLTHLRDRNVKVDLSAVAKNLSGSPFLGVNHSEVLAWAESVWRGAWHPE